MQPGNAGAPEKSASEACATPDSLYEMLYRKVVSLGLTDELTQIQEKKALEDWTAWFNTQRLAGRRVQWTTTLIEASEGQLRLVPDLSAGEWLFGGLGAKPGAALKLAGSVNGPSMSVDYLDSMLAKRKSDLKRLAERLADDRADKYLRNAVRECRIVIANLSRLRQETEAYPIKVIAKCDNEPRVFLVAWVGQHSKAALADVAPESEIALSGKIGEVVPYLSPDGVFLIEVVLDQCELAQERAAPPPVGDKDTDRDCREWLSLARNYIRAGMPEKAIPYLKQVIERYGDTEYAKEARDLGQEALQMIKALGTARYAPSRRRHGARY